MSIIDSILAFYQENILIKMLFIPLTLCAVMYFVCKHEDEFSWHAIYNNAATVTITSMNFIVSVFFVSEVNEFAQNIYSSSSIPTIDPTFWDGVPLIFVILAGIIGKDFADYWNHRFMHTTWLWPTHAAHHSDTYVSAFTVFRVHFLEGFVMLASYIILLTWFQIPQAIPVVAILYTIHGHYVHMNLPYTHGPLKYLIASPAFHRWHHADAPEAFGKNLSNLMPIWDKLFGTYYYPGPCKAPMGALSSGIEDKNAFLIFIYPFQEWARLIKQAAKKLSGKSQPAQSDNPSR